MYVFIRICSFYINFKPHHLTLLLFSQLMMTTTTMMMMAMMVMIREKGIPNGVAKLPRPDVEGGLVQDGGF